MICGKRLSLFLLVFSLALGPCLYSLSEEEKEILPLLSEEKLIEIILTYDRGLTDLETIIKVQEITLTKQNRLLIVQDDLFQTSLETQRKILKKNDLLKLGLYVSGGVIVVETIFIVATLIRGFR